MAFEVQDFHDLVQLLEQHPEWREELRRLVLSRELLELPEIARILVDAQRAASERIARLEEVQTRTEAALTQLAEGQRGLSDRIARLEESTAQLAEGQRGLSDRIARLEESTAQLAEGQRGLSDRIARLEEAQTQTQTALTRLTERVDRLSEGMETLTDTVRTLSGHVSWLRGAVTEQRYRERAASYFGRIARRVRALTTDELHDLIDQGVTQGAWTQDEGEELVHADVVARARAKDEGTEMYLVVEASWGIGTSDVQRAYSRARLLSRLGTPALPVVAGHWLTPEAEEPARGMKVWQVLDGRVIEPAA